MPRELIYEGKIRTGKGGRRRRRRGSKELRTGGKTDEIGVFFSANLDAASASRVE